MHAMPPPRSWTSPPTRREFTLLAFSLMIFVLSYNLETSLRMVGVSPSRLSSSYLGKVGAFMFVHVRSVLALTLCVIFPR